MRPFPYVIVPSPSGGWLRFAVPRQVLVATCLDEVTDVIAAADSETKSGAYVAGFVTYEAAPAFDAAQTVHASWSLLPLAWFAVYDAPPEPVSAPLASAHLTGRWKAAINRANYETAIGTIKQRIAAGDVYQTNFTYPLRASFVGSPLSLFAMLSTRQLSAWAFYVETDDWAVCSVSPECFFEKQGNTLISKPMKGTRRNFPGEAVRLAASAKDRAENLMIVDMLRNDMSRLPDARRVRVEALLAVEEYPTVLQMTSTIACQTQSGLHDIFNALFPCASITGAPKISAMHLIRQLEKIPRGLYCGACGWAGGNQARFNVGIRTAVVDKRAELVHYGVGSGVVADSSPSGEWRECRLKAAILVPKQKPHLIETMRADINGVVLWSHHLARLAASSRYFGFRFNRVAATQLVEAHCKTLSVPVCLRLTLSPDGELVLEQRVFPATISEVRACLSSYTVRVDDGLLRHKTTQREVYDSALTAARADGFDDAVLQNEKGEITETCIANIAVHISGEWLTPPVRCGLLPGVQRAALLAAGKLREAVITQDELCRADAVQRFNAVRGVENMRVAC
ncbi:chorismate-binding protein [Candidatus Persebacteraceae bacterium Df01]|jgi:para-aminobenzoate synthetase/4-amino-4-deoxychorismate lyase|uniref:Chorismate-binding protein n=1 Tax=Candidatus Doriopsillibacter californiensis TaxID=2970740 RepID=A0ABT7QKG6_9GAMM|nr:chorismate-binding protein [Candidatus Persebacteraceae bacterium Df01]